LRDLDLALEKKHCFGLVIGSHPNTVDGSEIHLWDVESVVNNRDFNYQPQLVRFRWISEPSTLYVSHLIDSP